MDVTELVQEQSFVEGAVGVQENRAAEGDAGNVRHAERPAAKPGGDPAATKASRRELGISLRHLGR